MWAKAMTWDRKKMVGEVYDVATIKKYSKFNQQAIANSPQWYALEASKSPGVKVFVKSWPIVMGI